MNLYHVVLYKDDGREHLVFYIIAPDETTASKSAIKANEKYDYSSFVYVKSIEKLASEGQYGKPKTLLVVKKNDNDSH